MKRNLSALKKHIKGTRMKEKTKVVLLGGSNYIAVNGLQKGLRQENIELTNLALGGTIICKIFLNSSIVRIKKS